MIKPPIFIDNHGDITVFTSVQDAENWIEPIDARNNEYEAFDSEGRLLCLVVEKQEGLLRSSCEFVRIVEAETNPFHAADLCQRLRTFLNMGGEHEVDTAVLLPELVNAARRFASK